MAKRLKVREDPNGLVALVDVAKMCKVSRWSMRRFLVSHPELSVALPPQNRRYVRRRDLGKVQEAVKHGKRSGIA